MTITQLYRIGTATPGELAPYAYAISPAAAPGCIATAIEDEEVDDAHLLARLADGKRAPEGGTAGLAPANGQPARREGAGRAPELHHGAHTQRLGSRWRIACSLRT